MEPSAERLARLEAKLADLGVDLADIIPVLGVHTGPETAGRFPVVELAPIQLRELLLERSSTWSVPRRRIDLS